jgi:hypothetical protein
MGLSEAPLTQRGAHVHQDVIVRGNEVMRPSAATVSVCSPTVTLTPGSPNRFA